MYIYAKTNLEGMKAGAETISEEFLSKDLSCVSAEDLWDEFRHKLSNTVEDNIPSKIVRKRNNSPW